MIAEIVTLHERLVAYHLNLAVERLSPRVVTPTNRTVAYVPGIGSEKRISPDALCHTDLKSGIRVFYYLQRQPLVEAGSELAYIRLEAVVGCAAGLAFAIIGQLFYRAAVLAAGTTL